MSSYSFLKSIFFVPIDFTYILFPNQIPAFVRLSSKLLNILTETQNCDIVELKFEVMLQDNAEPALSTRANKQPRANTELVELHAQLLEVMLIISSLNVTIKGTINSLFNEVSRELLCCDISKELSESILRPDDPVNKSRKHFLHRTIHVAVDLIRKDFQEVYSTDFNLWIDKVMGLAKKWTLNQEELIKYQVVQLYTRGWDECAEIKLKDVSQPSSMGKMLISITGTRLNNFVKDNPELYSRVLAIGSRVSSYLERLVRKSSGICFELRHFEIEANFIRNKASKSNLIFIFRMNLL